MSNTWDRLSSLKREKAERTNGEIWRGCIQSFFRNRHTTRPRFKTGKHRDLVVSNFKEYRGMIRWYIQKIRQEEGDSNEEGHNDPKV